LVAFLAITIAMPAAAADSKAAAMVFDANSGKTLYARNADAERYPASLTKMMTLYILFEELRAKRVSLSTPFTVSDLASRQAPSKLGLKPGSTITAEDCILSLVTKSANDAAVVIAENVAGSVPAFAARMNRTAKALGMTQTNFRNPNGLPDPAQHTTARDLIRLGLALQDRFPEYYKYFSTASFTYRGARIRNHNNLIGHVAGVDGIKTGYTRASGFNIVTNVNRDGRHVIAVVMGGQTASRRDAQMRELLAKYVPQASAGPRETPMLVAGAGALGVAKARLPRSRPDLADADTALAYADAGPSHDLVSQAMAEARDAQGDVGEDPENDPIAHRIEVASAVAQFADISIENAKGDPIAELMRRARARAVSEGAAPANVQVAAVTQDVIAAGPAGRGETADAEGGDVQWYVQIGAVPSKDGAKALLEDAQDSMGSVLASMEPVTQTVQHRGTTLYRARFAGFSDKEAARATCAKMKRKDISCLAVPN
jgi:D-alanyl-D-alanine carboxypeptidase